MSERSQELNGGMVMKCAQPSHLSRELSFIMSNQGDAL